MLIFSKTTQSINIFIYAPEGCQHFIIPIRKIGKMARARSGGEGGGYTTFLKPYGIPRPPSPPARFALWPTLSDFCSVHVDGGKVGCAYTVLLAVGVYGVGFGMGRGLFCGTLRL